MDVTSFKLMHTPISPRSPHMLSVPGSPHHNFLSLGGLFGFTSAHHRSFADESPILSMSVTFNALEDLNEEGTDAHVPIYYGTDAAMHKTVRINGKSHVTKADIRAIAEKKRPSLDTVATMVIEAGLAELDGMAECNAQEQEEELQTPTLTLDAVHLDDESPVEVTVEKHNRRLTSFTLRTFNSFGLSVPGKLKAQTSQIKKVAKKIGKPEKSPKSKAGANRKIEKSLSRTRTPSNVSAVELSPNATARSDFKFTDNSSRLSCAVDEYNLSFDQVSLAEDLSV